MDSADTPPDLHRGVTSTEEFLEHFGVKGMKWGKRGASKEPASADAKKSIDIRTRAKKSKATALTNAELQSAINRMQLEQNFKRLTVNEKSAATRFIASTLLEVGKREVQATIAKKAVKLAAKVAV